MQRHRPPDASRRQTRDKGNVIIQQINVCAVCHGRGSVIDKPCPGCALGQTQHEEAAECHHPGRRGGGHVGAAHPGRGMPNRESGGRPGDLFIVVHSEPDPRFERNGADLWRSESIAVADAVLGTKLMVPTLWSKPTR